MSKKYFGTDGIRGRVNKFPMMPDIALKVGMAVGAKFTKGNHRHRVIIGKDTRLSGYVIEPALTAGFAAVGMEVFLLGPVPTPAVSMLTKSLRADIGIMISASHNPYYDNGIKIFNRDGEKLGDDIEQEIESLLDSDINTHLAPSSQLGRVKRLEDAKGRYIEFVKNTFPKDKRLDGIKIVLDCANGAAYAIAPTVLWELGAEVISIGVKPNGFNINDGCGSTNTKLLCQEVIKNKADIGLALDGDADRIVIVNEKGQALHGDHIIGLIATRLHKNRQLKGGGIAVTQMSNMGLAEYIQSLSLELKRSAVGDRYVLELMKKSGYNFGGEQSGHLVLSDYSTTGDGLTAALQILAILCEEKKPISEIAAIFPLTPQVLKNVYYQASVENPLAKLELQNLISQSEARLGKEGRILVRKSGTENLIRVMVEGKDEQLIETLAEHIATELKNHLN